MTRLGWIGSLCMVLGLALGTGLGWGLCRAVSGFGQTGKLVQVSRIPPHGPVEIVPASVDWPEGEPVQVATVEPPTKKESRKLERDFGFRLGKDSLLGKFELPDLPDGGKAMVTVPKRDGKDPEPVKLTVKANIPPLVRIRWDPRLEGWYGYSVEGSTWSGYLELGRLLCIRDRVCLAGRAGYEVRPWGDGAVAGAGVSVRF